MDNNDFMIREDHLLSELILTQKKWRLSRILSIVVLVLITIYMAASWYQENAEHSVRFLYAAETCLFGVLLVSNIICVILCSGQIRKTRDIMKSGILQTTEKAKENCGREWQAFAEKATSVLNRMTKALLAVLLPAAGLLTFHLLYGVNAPSLESQSQPSVSKTQETAESESTYDSFTEMKKFTNVILTTDPGQPYVEVPAYQSAEEWMKNRTIIPEILYEDDQYKLELTGYSFQDGDLLVETMFTNNSEETASAGAVAGSVYINDMVGGVYMISSYDMKTDRGVLPGHSGTAAFRLSEDLVPTFDPWLEKLEFRLEVWKGDSNFSNPRTRLLTTDPIIIYTQADDGQDSAVENTEEFALVPEPELKVLYESDEMRVIGRGIRGQLYDDEGEYVMPDPYEYFTRTVWEFLVENRTDHEMVVDHLTCSVNGEKALSMLMDEQWLEIPDPEHTVLNEYYEVEFNCIPKAIDAGKRRQFYYFLNRAENTESIVKEETAEDIRQADWLLDEIRTASAGFVVNYTDAAGEARQIEIADEYSRPVR